MTVRFLATAGLFLAVVGGEGAAQQGPPPGSFEMLTEVGTAVIPFDLDRNLVRMTGTIGGLEVNLHLDTGFPYDGIVLFGSPEVDALDLPYSGKIQVGGAGSSDLIPADIALGQVVEFPGIRLTEQAITVMPFDSVRNRVFDGAHGTIGGSLFNRLVVGVDFERMELTLSEPEGFEYSGTGQVVPLGTRPDLARTLSVGVESTEGARSTLEVVLDLGAAHAISINVNAADEIMVPEDAVESSLGRGLSGEVFGHVGRIRRLTLGDFVFNDVVTAFSTSPWMEEIEGHGNLGSRVLQRFRVVFDYERDRIFLEPNSRFGDPFEFDLHGGG